MYIAILNDHCIAWQVIHAPSTYELTNAHGCMLTIIDTCMYTYICTYIEREREKKKSVAA